MEATLHNAITLTDLERVRALLINIGHVSLVMNLLWYIALQFVWLRLYNHSWAWIWRFLLECHVLDIAATLRKLKEAVLSMMLLGY